jgi:hypothetical protein
MPADYKRIQELVKAFDFKKLFTELMWNHLQTRDLQVPVDGITYALLPLAERGMAVYICVPPGDAVFPKYSTRRKIDVQLSKTAREHIIIFHDSVKTVQIWQWVKKEAGKPSACREQIYYAGQSADALTQKIQSIQFSLEDDPNVLETRARVGSAFDVEKVTKKFYEEFKKEHDAFLKFIKGIPEEHLQRWYVSVMLNRLMFIYFIQKKGFLSGDQNYLANRLTESKKRGKDIFFTRFLCSLFFNGFAKREEQRSPEINHLLGRIPYLNGGLFLKHQIEELHGERIEISDRAFERIFEFFDGYDWLLDDRPTHTGREINPDVLGYVFEKYINQKEMGAYYTKEDITGYISQNTIIPALFDIARKSCRIAFEGEHSVWRLLQEDSDSYIYPAMLHGVDRELPINIMQGMADVTKRSAWNNTATSEIGLPTETWRDVVARRERCIEIRRKLVAGGIRDINDLITYNLDVRRFAEEVIANSEGPELLRAFYTAIAGGNANQAISVLDPACGSGAFLFAALNILALLYDACLTRMQAFIDDLDRSNQKHSPEKYSDFRKILAEMNDRTRHPKPRYFILKSIILNNLYGVDIMEEATEICKLRLFLKLVAQVNTGERIEPLPDIDFNIRSGNTVVGYGSETELDKALGRLGHAERKVEIKEKAEAAGFAFKRFRQQQVVSETGSPDEMANWKSDLAGRLAALREELDDYLAGEYNLSRGDKKSQTLWKENHQPFHWFVEFFGIMSKGGFDAIIGNPPYAEIPQRYDHPILRKHYKTLLERWSRDEDLYTIFVERSLQLMSSNGGFGMILPLSLSFSTKKSYQMLRSTLKSERGSWWWSHFDRIPSALFGNEVRTRCTIAILRRDHQPLQTCTTALLRWESDARLFLFSKIAYADVTGIDIAPGIPKIGSQIQADALRQLTDIGAVLGLDLQDTVAYTQLVESAPRFPEHSVFVGGTAYNWFPAWRDIPPTTSEDGRASVPARTIGFRYRKEADANIMFALLCSSLGYWWWAVASDGFNLKKWLLERLPLSMSTIPPDGRKALAKLGAELQLELRKHYVFKDNKGRIGNYYLPACYEQINAIDATLANSIGLSAQFFESVREFNLSFSRAKSFDSEEASENATS